MSVVLTTGTVRFKDSDGNIQSVNVLSDTSKDDAITAINAARDEAIQSMSLDDKQDKLIAGSGIIIAEDGRTISVDGSYIPSTSSYSITVNLSTNNGKAFTSTVSLYNSSTGELVSQKNTSGVSVTFVEPIGLEYTIKFSTPAGYTDLEDISGILSSSITITKVFCAQIVYGFHINGNESDPASMVTYLEDAVGMTPAHMDFESNAFNWGSWRNAFFIPRPCMIKFDGTVDYYLNQNDYSKRVDGSASDITNTEYEGNAMMEWGQDGYKIWTKVVPDTNNNNSVSVYIANSKVDSGYHAYSFINSNGTLVNHFYTPIYIGSYIGSIMRSLSGQTISQIKNGSGEIAAAQENGEGWNTEVNCDITLINYLLILMCESTDMQNAFGYGRCGYSNATSGVAKTGLMDSNGMFWGQNIYDGTEIGVKVFGMEHWWGNQWRRFAGLVNDNGNIKYKMCYGTEDGSETDNYNTTGEGYISSNIKMSGTNGGYLSKMIFSSDGSANPIVANGSSSTYYCDYLCFDNAQLTYACHGGSYNTKLLAGAFAFNLNGTIVSANTIIAAALSYKPLA